MSNNKAWSVCPKITTCGHKIVKIDIYDAVASFVYGIISKLKILEKLDVQVGKYAIETLGKHDYIQVASSEKLTRVCTL
jgi:hypothetical protein